MPTKQVVIRGTMTYDDDAHPAHPIVIPPGSIGPGVPTHPIVLPPPIPSHPIIIPPDAISPGVPAHPIVLPPYYPAHPIVIPPDCIAPGVPTHPIYLPPGIWGGGNEPFPTPPIHIPGPGRPEHPIYNPPSIWGPTDPRPTHPISGIPGLPGYEPPQQPPNLPPGGTPIPPAVNVPIDGKLVWIPGYGWTFIPDGALKPPTNGDEPHVDHTLPGDLKE